MVGDSFIERLVEYVIKHNAGIIEGLLAAIALAAIYLSYLSLKAKPEPAVAGIGNLGDLEETLKKLIEKTSLMPAAGAGTPSPEMLTQIDTLKRNLEERKVEIETLKAAAAEASSATGLSSDDRANLEAQIKELSNKLAEYEIISEDIADLSFYKEENAKLLKQLESSKASAPAAAPVAAAAVATAVAPKAEPEIVGKSKAKAEPPPPAPAPVEPAPAAAVDDDLMAEFAKAIEDQKGGKSEAPTAPKEPATDEANLGSLDMDKMLAEANDIQSAPASDIQVNALESTLDENKLLQEATALEEGLPVKSDDKKLMNEFENFVKKGNT